MKLTYQRIDNLFISGILFYNFFCPTLHVWLGSAGAILVNAGLMVLAFLYLMFKGFRIRFLEKSERKIYLFVVILMAAYLFLIAFSTLFLSKEIIFEDLFELHKPVLYSLAFTLPFLFVTTLKKLTVIENILNLCFGLILIFCINHYFAISDFISSLYTKQINVVSRRLTVPFVNPYDQGFMMLFFYILYLLKSFFSKLRFFYIPALLAALAVIVFTQSRTAIIATAFSTVVILTSLFLLIYGMAIYQRKITRNLVVQLLSFVIVIGFCIYLIQVNSSRLEYLINGINVILEQRESVSIQNRQDQFDFAIQLAGRNPFVFLFGNGVSKAAVEYLESSYAFFLFRYGVVGMVTIFVLPLLLALVLGFRSALATVGRSKLFLWAIFLWLLAIPVGSFGNNFTEQIRLSFIYYFLMGLVCRTYFLREPPPLPTTSLSS